MSHEMNQRIHCRRCHHASAGDAFGGPEATTHYAPDLELEPRHIDIDLHIDVEAQRAEGRVTTTVQARTAGDHTLTLNALDFEAVQVRDPDGRDLSWRYDGQRLTARWAEPFLQDEQRRVEVAYRVVEPTSGLHFSSPDAGWAHRPRFAATDHESERAQHWLPCVDLPAVRTTLDLHLRADAAFTILANGALLREEDHGDGTRTAHWRLEQPCPSYLICFALGDLIRVEDTPFEGAPVAYFTSNNYSADDLRRAFHPTPDMLAWMTARLDHPLPWPKYFQFALPEFGGAMENISLVSWDDLFILDPTWEREFRGVTDIVNVHEMAHTFFGDLVVCRDFAHAWLKESWATYMENVWLEDNRGQDDLRYNLLLDADAYLAEADEVYKRPIVTRRFASSWQMYDNHLYPGGALRLHTLRMELGDEVFWRAVRLWLRRYAFQTVETDDFRRLMEEVSGRSLARFFDQWFYRPGYPHLKVEFEHDPKHGVGRFTITQLQAPEDREPAPHEPPLFALRAEVGWRIDGVDHTAPAWLDRRTHTVSVPMPTPPQHVRFDPNGRILCKLDLNPGDDLLAHQLLHAADTAGRIHAARTLASTGRRVNVTRLIDAWAQEPFWGVRREIARALAKINLPAAAQALARILTEEQDDRALEGAALAAIGLRDPAVLDALRQRAQAGGLAYRAAGAAWEALGHLRDQAPLDLLRDVAQRDTHLAITQNAAIRGLAHTRTQEAADLLLTLTEPQRLQPRARGAAVLALGRIAPALPPHARLPLRERLQDLLRDPSERLRLNAFHALGALGDPAAAPALQAALPTFTHQTRVKLQSTLDALRSDADPQLDALRKQVEELNTRCAKLDQQLQTLQSRVEEKNQGE